LLTSEQNLCEMALVKNAARNGAVCYHHDSKENFVLLCLFLPQDPTLYRLLYLVAPTTGFPSPSASPNPSPGSKQTDALLLLGVYR